MERSEEILHLVGDRGAGSRRHTVQLAAVAGGEDDSFVENSAAAKLAGSVKRLFRCERNALAKFDRSRAMVAADQRDAYARRGRVRRQGSSNWMR